MHYKLTFCYPKYPKIILAGFVTAIDENEAKTKFRCDYPNLLECEIREVILYEV